MRTVDLDPATLDVLTLWRKDQRDALGHEPVGLFTKHDGTLLNPRVSPRPSSGSWHAPSSHRSPCTGCGNTHATLLLKADVSLKVVSGRLGRSTPAFTKATYQHVLPGMQADAAATFAALGRSRPADFYRVFTR